MTKVAKTDTYVGAIKRPPPKDQKRESVKVNFALAQKTLPCPKNNRQ